MKCQHCGSTDIVVIQGQNYCLNCGYAVVTPIPEEAPLVAEAPVVPSKLKRKTVKTAKLAAAAVAPKGADIIPSTPSRRRQSPTSDIRPSAPKSPKTVTVHPLRFSLTAALAAAVVSGLVTTMALWFHLDSDTGAYVITATVVGLGIGVGLAHTALLYGRSRSQDGRPAPREYWWIAARTGFMDVINVQLITIISALLLVGIGLAAWQAAIAISAYLAMVVTGVILGLVNLVLIWALIGVYAAARLATPAVVVGGLSATEAVRVGWRLYLKAGGHLVAASIEALLSRTMAAVVLAVAGYTAATMLTVTGSAAEAIGGGIGIGLVMFCACMLTLEVDTKLWLAQYRHWATLCPPAERIRLLTGRVQSHL